MNKLSQREEAERLVETYSDLILRLCWTYLKNTQDAEDICQNTFVNFCTEMCILPHPNMKKPGLSAQPPTSAKIC